ncbi:hypothetical protein GcM3_064008 [Golovinomyces cichoracearum]|uniref:HCNGP-like protein n=1 Tax=Golovinomyces cichoracearum TaxID=62708 RepID=A0A420IV45_9PEZI|nr:hypothetical protein GcM3_064008 [Golovinomyces cichoracearum]
MSALVCYSSSGDEDEALHQSSDSNVQNISWRHTDNEISTSEENIKKQPSSHSPQHKTDDLKTPAPLIGPQFPDPVIKCNFSEDAAFNALSPYSKNRAMLRNLTISKQPNYDIPPSPHGSPKKSTEAKFNHFLELKKQGVHFNQKLAKSTALRNPSLMQNLLDFAGIDEIGQYLSTLPESQWNPNIFPKSAYKDELSESQKRILKAREDEKTKVPRETVDFIPANPLKTL